jgi:MoaA/NifB/PqqE/SkfB family radical SAM enzyme
MGSLYWDLFEERIKETVDSLKVNRNPIVQRVAVFITQRCNLSCAYCNAPKSRNMMEEATLKRILEKYPNAIIHITGGEPSLVPWLYPFIEKTDQIKFHLNTNAVIKPAKNIKRLKVSLDSCNENYVNKVVGKPVFNTVVQHIKEASKETVASITCTLTKENYESAPEFMRFCRKQFPDLYAVFFSIYKGTNERFKFEQTHVNRFFNEIRPNLLKEMDKESKELFEETIDEKRRLLEGIRFPENGLNKTCYISLSERVVDWAGNEYGCSHLYRDGVFMEPGKKHEKCSYGCNRRLVTFNEQVEKLLC